MIYLYECTIIFKEAERTDAQFPAFGKKGKRKTKEQIQVKIQPQRVKVHKENSNGYRGTENSFRVYFVQLTTFHIQY